ncbi:MAG TPA: helix-turn-helix transcriptional regulator [Candidatus Merdivicinus faecavium]|nr:helix-turn-helix transcriptional regulator [Candidatus Merdivicinus faecavium]
MLLKEINRVIFKAFGTPLKSVEGYENFSQSVYEDDTRVRSSLWHFEKEVVLEPLSGVGLLFVRAEGGMIQKFMFDQPLLINPGVQFAVLPYECTLSYRLYYQSPKIITPTANVLTGQGFVPNIHVKTLYTVLYQEKDKQFQFNGEEHPFWELTYVNKGRMICEVDGETYQLQQGQMIFFAPHQFHLQRSDGKAPLSFLTLTFDGELDRPDMLSNRVVYCDENCLNIVRSMIREEKDGQPYGDDMITCELTRLIITVVRNTLSNAVVVKVPTRLKVTVDNKYIGECIDLIHSNITSTITLPWLAKQLNLSSSYLSSLFKQKVGRSISEYVRLVRLEKVKELIGEGKYTIAQISHIMGYCSPTYLSTEFRREFDMSPKEYAKMLE